jgi:hypothetical protein
VDWLVQLLWRDQQCDGNTKNGKQRRSNAEVWGLTKRDNVSREQRRTSITL